MASICLNFYSPKSALYIIVALVFRIIVNKKKSVTYCQQVLFIVKVFCVHKLFIALFVEYPLCFLLCHNLHLHMLKTCSIGKTVLSVSCARFKSHICKLRHPPSSLSPRNPCICPCLSRRRRSTQISRLCPFSSRRRRSERLSRRLVNEQTPTPAKNDHDPRTKHTTIRLSH